MDVPDGKVFGHSFSILTKFASINFEVQDEFYYICLLLV